MQTLLDIPTNCIDRPEKNGKVTVTMVTSHQYFFPETNIPSI